MPSRLARTQRQTNTARRITNADLAASITDLGSKLGVRLDKLEAVVKDSGLNGYSPYLKKFLQDYADTSVQKQAWLTVQSDLAHRLRWVTTPKAWLRVVFYAVLGGVGWGLASHFLSFPSRP